MMKAAQAPGVGGLPMGAPNPGGHSPSHQNLHGGNLPESFVIICHPSQTIINI